MGREALFLEQFSHEFHSRVLVASSLDQKIENLAFIVDRPPQPESLAVNQHGHLVEVPRRSRPMAPTAKLPGEQRPEFQYPSSHRFVGDIQTSLGEQIFHVAVAERETHIQPNGVPDDRGRKLMARKRDRRHSLS
jgi:hypothetical protein